MDRSGRAGCDPCRGNLGAPCFAHQQPRRAVSGEDHGWGCPIPVLSRQGRLQRSGVICLAFAALLRRNRGGDPQLLGGTKAETSSSEVHAGDAGCAPGCRGSAGTGGGTNPGREFRTFASRIAAGGTFSVTRRILVATETATTGCARVSSSAAEAGQTQAA